MGKIVFTFVNEVSARIWTSFDSTLCEIIPAVLLCNRHRGGQGVRKVCPRDEHSLRTPLLTRSIPALHRGNVIAWSLDLNCHCCTTAWLGCKTVVPLCTVTKESRFMTRGDVNTVNPPPHHETS